MAPGGGQFFQRTLSYMINNLLVETLANRFARSSLPLPFCARAALSEALPRPLRDVRPRSRTFQRAAVKVDAASREAARKAPEAAEKAAEIPQAAKSFTQDFRREMSEQLFGYGKKKSRRSR
jgi:hypothetical protein